MKVKTITVSLNRSTKMADYQYYKTGVTLEATLTAKDDFDKCEAELYAKADELLTLTILRERQARMTDEQLEAIDEVLEECGDAVDAKSLVVRAALGKLKDEITVNTKIKLI